MAMAPVLKAAHYNIFIDIEKTSVIIAAERLIMTGQTQQPNTQIRRLPVIDVKKEQCRLLEKAGLVDSDYTGPVVLTLDFHRGSLNKMKIDKPITL